MGDDHRDDRDRGDRAARGIQGAGRQRRAERFRFGVQRKVVRPVPGAVHHQSAAGSRPRDEADLRADAGDRGSAVAEFALVLVLLLMLFLALVSVGLWAYTRTLLTSAAADAAREAANYDASSTITTGQVAEMLGDGLSGATRSTLQCTSGVQGLLVTVNCTMEAPGIVGLLDGVMPTIEVTGHSAKETIQ
ncbi:MAG: TadE/TadG family type IV pilus assembly protein [Nakamurella sp.]